MTASVTDDYGGSSEAVEEKKSPRKRKPVSLVVMTGLALQ